MQKVASPTLLVSESVCRKNIQRMAEKAKRLGVVLRPHFKTHQSHAIGQWFKEEGVTGITVSSLGMANYFAQAGWKDITVAFPCNINELELINELAAKIELRILVDNQETINKLSSQLKNEVKIYIEIDAGGNRTGVNADNYEEILVLADLIKSKPMLNLLGIYSHSGHTYNAKGKDDIRKIAENSLSRLAELKSKLSRAYPEIELCYGDTPSCSVLENLTGVDAISAGNYVFYDVMQTEIGTCDVENIGLAVACPVVSIKKEKNQVFIYGGAVHFSKDRTGDNNFGSVASYNGNRFELVRDAYLSKISQEHGIVTMGAADIRGLSIGDSLMILPIHSCLTAECLGGYRLIDDPTKKLDHYSQKKHVI